MTSRPYQKSTYRSNRELTIVWPSQPPKRTDPSIGLNMPPERGSAHNTTATTRPDMASDAAIGELLARVGFSAISGMPRPSARLPAASVARDTAGLTPKGTLQVVAVRDS